MKIGYILIIILHTLCFSYNLNARQKNDKQQADKLFKAARHRVGWIGGIGTQKGLYVPYKYRINYWQFQYYFALLRKKTWGVDLLVQPQYNFTKYRPKDRSALEITGYEWGLNVGALIRKNFLRDFLSLYGIISVGPHYVSDVPQRQIKGFIFSDNFLAGINIRLWNNIYLDIRSGFRHISNANLALPNGGVNDVFIGLGLLMNVGKK